MIGYGWKRNPDRSCLLLRFFKFRPQKHGLLWVFRWFVTKNQSLQRSSSAPLRDDDSADAGEQCKPPRRATAPAKRGGLEKGAG